MAEPNWPQRAVFVGDNLHVMRGMNSESVDLIYLDPPFNSNRNYAAPVGSKAAEAAFKDSWTLDDVDVVEHDVFREKEPGLYAVVASAKESHSTGMFSYLLMMAMRLLEMRRLLRNTGSIYLHCDPTAGHYLKMLMDAVFGRDQFLNEIIWGYGLGGSSKRLYSKKHDVILFYSKTSRYFFDKPRVPATSQMMRGQMKAAWTHGWTFLRSTTWQRNGRVIPPRSRWPSWTESSRPVARQEPLCSTRSADALPQW